MNNCGPRPGEAALAPPSQVWVRFNSNEPATLNTLIQYMWWPWVCRERNARSPVSKNARATVNRTVLCRLDVLDMYLIKHLTRGFLQILIIRDVMNFWNVEVWDFSEMPILNLRFRFLTFMCGCHIVGFLHIVGFPIGICLCGCPAMHISKYQMLTV